MAEKLIDVLLAGDLREKFLLVVVAKRTTELVVVHLGARFENAPATRELVGIENAKRQRVFVDPRDHRLVSLLVEKIEEEFPQLSRTAT